ncbi:MAG TPA: c-type cytochrome [Anaerolineales bacterium]
MSRRENFVPYHVVGLALSLAILGTFQLYIQREPARIQANLVADQEAAVNAGEGLYVENCSACHGERGEGLVGPPLNSRELLRNTPDGVLFGLIRTGVPGTNMPAWGQSLGGPFTDEQVGQLTAFIRAWEPTAPQIVVEQRIPDPVRGATLFESTCFVCHGQNGRGTEIAPAINDRERLALLEDDWYREVIANGRPAKGMPTWGTVLSPEQIADLVALIRAWRDGLAVAPDISLARRVSSALFAVREFDPLDATFQLGAALAQAEGPEAVEIQHAVELIRENRLFEAEALLVGLFPPEEMGRELFTTHCAACHGESGTGKTGPNLHDNSFVQSRIDEDLESFILEGRRGTAMNGFGGILASEEVANLIALLRSWQPR